jgi:hypothetical protein
VSANPLLTPEGHRWPQVPAVYGWLELDGRGNWLLRDSVDAAHFERVTNWALNLYISDNYGNDVQGRWYFQNGPQRVYVRLHRTPLVFRFVDGRWRDHCGQSAGRVSAAWLDEMGAVILQGERGAGVVDDRDLRFLANLLVDTGRAADQAGVQEEDFLLRCEIGEGGQSEYLPLRRLKESLFEQVLGFVAEPMPEAGLG